MANRSAVINACFSSSIAHGPPISASGAPPPIVSAPIRTSSVVGWPLMDSPRRLGRRTVSPRTAIVLQGGPHEPREERVRLPRPRAELRVELAGDEVRVLGDLDDLDELLLRPDAGDAEAGLLESGKVVVVHLVAVAVALLDDALAVQARGQAALAEDDRIETEPHRATLVGDRALLGQEVDHQVRRGRIELCGARAGEAADVPRVLDHGALHAQADPEVRHAPLARVTHRLDLSQDPAVAEAAGHQDAVDARELSVGPVALDVLGIHPLHVHARLVRDAAVRERLDEALVGVPQLDVLADDRDACLRMRGLDPT